MPGLPRRAALGRWQPEREPDDCPSHWPAGGGAVVPDQHLAPDLDLVWSYEKRFCCKQPFRDQKSGVFHLAECDLRDPARIDRLLFVFGIAVLASSLQGCALSLAGMWRHVDPHWKRAMSFLDIGLAALQMAVADARPGWWIGCRSHSRNWSPAAPVVRPEEGRRGLSSPRFTCHRDGVKRLITRHNPLSLQSRA